MDVAGLGQVDGDGAGDAAERLAPADDAGNGLLVHAVLQRDDVAVGRQVLADQHGGPGRVVGLHADEGDVDRFLLGELLGVGDVERAHGHGKFRHIAGVRDAQPVLAHRLHVLGPRVDEGHVLAGLHHVRAGISPDRARPDDRNLPAHAFLPACLTAEGSAPAGQATTVAPPTSRAHAKSRGTLRQDLCRTSAGAPLRRGRSGTLSGSLYGAGREDDAAGARPPALAVVGQ